MNAAVTYPIRGDVDMANAPELRRHLVDIIQAGEADELVVDCTELTFIDSSGVRVLVEVHNRSQELGRRIRIVNLSPQCESVIDILGLGEVLPVETARGVGWARQRRRPA